jgi:hypothetical protein
MYKLATVEEDGPCQSGLLGLWGYLENTNTRYSLPCTSMKPPSYMIHASVPATPAIF